MKTKLLKMGFSSLLLAPVLQTMAQQHPNIILFMVDDMGWQDTSVPFWSQRTPLNDVFQTPNMEQMASQGMKFTQAYASAVSSPSRVSLLTGMNAARHRVTNWTLEFNKPTDGKSAVVDIAQWNVNGLQPSAGTDRSVVATTFPQILHNNGYTTIHCGKSHVGSIGTLGADPKNLGFDINIAGHAAGGISTYQGLKNYGNDENGIPQSVWAVPGLEKYFGKDINLTDALTREAIKALDENRKSGKPFYLYMSHYTVHIPLEPDNRFYQKYVDKGYDKPQAMYASMLEGMDKSLGDLMEYLRVNKMEKNTIIIFMSDNGGFADRPRGGKAYTQNAPLRSGKGSAYEGGIRVPMMVVWPGIVKPGSVNSSYLQIDDFFPSILELAGVKQYKTIQTLDGKSFVPALKGKTINSKRPLFWHFPNIREVQGPGFSPSSTVRLGDYKLIYFHEDKHFELYNIAKDIGESENLAATMPMKVKEMAKILGSYLRKVDAQMPTYKSNGAMVPWPDEAAK